MVRVLRKIVGKIVTCPNCGNELAFDDSNEKYYSFRSDAMFIYCACGCCIGTRNGDGSIAKGVTLMTVNVNEETENGKD